VYVATATAEDEEMAERIAHHRARRPAEWLTVEAPTDVASRTAQTLHELGVTQPSSVEATPTGDNSLPRRSDADTPTVLVEDLTLLLSNLFVTDESAAERAASEEIEALLALEANVILVANEVGMGVVPPYPLGRAFRDALGRLNQFAASACDEVYLVVAGLPLRLK
jgi:adenosylcobinamide kinase / adenosylcobinamide-phosphate guanylyltransferase